MSSFSLELVRVVNVVTPGCEGESGLPRDIRMCWIGSFLSLPCQGPVMMNASIGCIATPVQADPLVSGF